MSVRKSTRKKTRAKIVDKLCPLKKVAKGKAVLIPQDHPLHVNKRADLGKKVSEERDRLFDSMGQAATSLETSLEVLKWAKRAGCSAFKAGGRVREKEFRDWISKNPFKKEEAKASGGYFELKDLKTEQEVRKLKIRNDKEEEKLVDRKKLFAQASPTLSEIRDLLRQKLEREWPKEVSGLSIPEAQVFGRELVNEILGKFQKVFSRWEC